MVEMKIPLYIGIDVATGEPLYLPADFSEQRTTITGKSGKGKSFTAGIMMELMASRDEQFCVVDPRGAHIGLRNLMGKGGLPTDKKSGLNVMIVGGETGDIPLVPEGGAELADVLMETKVSCVLNIKNTGPKDRERFLIDFGRRLYQKNSDLLHLFIEEADEIIPQQTSSREETAICHEWRKIVKGGRSDGLLSTIVTQQPQAVDKRCINASDCLITMGLMGTTDIKALDEWFENHIQDAAQRKAIKQSIVTMPAGEGWILAPQWLGKMVHVKFRDRVTYHAGRTPKRGELRVQVKPHELGSVVEKIKGLMAEKSKAVAEKMRTDQDLHRELMAKTKAVQQLEDQIKHKKNWEPSAQDLKTMSALHETNEGLKLHIDDQNKKHIEFAKTVDGMADRVAGEIAESIKGSLRKFGRDILHALTPGPLKKFVNLPPRIVSNSQATTIQNLASSVWPQKGSASNGIVPGERKILNIIAQYPEGCTGEQIAVISGYKATSRNEYLRLLRTKGYITSSGNTHYATGQGVSALGDGFRSLPTGVDLQNYWYERLSPGEQKILRLLCENYPDALGRESVMEQIGYKATSTNEYLRQLINRKLVDVVGRSDVKASSRLF